MHTKLEETREKQWICCPPPQNTNKRMIKYIYVNKRNEKMSRNWLSNESFWVTQEKIMIYLFFFPPSVLFPSTKEIYQLFDQKLIVNVRYRPAVDFGNLGLDGRLSTLESVVYACPGCAAAP